MRLLFLIKSEIFDFNIEQKLNFSLINRENYMSITVIGSARFANVAL